jgi:hypothetical protein
VPFGRQLVRVVSGRYGRVCSVGRRTQLSWTTLLVVGLVAVAAGCGSSGAGSAAGPKPCAAVNGSQIRSAFGSGVGKGSPSNGPGQRWCFWGDPGTTYLAMSVATSETIAHDRVHPEPTQPPDTSCGCGPETSLGPVPANLAAEYARTPDKTPVGGIGQQAKWTTYSKPGFAGGRLTVLDHDYVLQIVISGVKVHPARLEQATLSLARQALSKLQASSS